ncbi:unnamed protein product [Leptidea sinapis]|uniref:Uncharacterized protein n=1 Tax=Leptidea sinapis TaxID=189913 RepID=A0A5E4Q2W7_9NEOP|nr:unnamed protein product [Leptidea sinapis]
MPLNQHQQLVEHLPEQLFPRRVAYQLLQEHLRWRSLREATRRLVRLGRSWLQGGVHLWKQQETFGRKRRIREIRMLNYSKHSTLIHWL